jgi:hypothetical protein
MVGGIHRHRVGDEHQVELAAFGDAGDLLHHRQFHVRGECAVHAPARHVVAGAEYEDAEMHLTVGRLHGVLASCWLRRSHGLMVSRSS